MSPKGQSILLGAAVVALLSTSYLGFINCLCCAGVIAGAMVAVWHYTNTNSLTIPAGEGAVIGLSAAALGGVISLILNFLLISIGLGAEAAMQEFALDFLAGRVPPEQLEEIEAQMAAGQSAGAYFVNGLCGIVIFVIFGAIGGVIGASVFKKGPAETDTPPPAPPPPAL